MNRNVKHPIRNGPWDWRAWLPTDDEEMDQLRIAATKAAPDGVHVGRFLAWVEAEMNGHESPITSSRSLARYRRLLYELRPEGPIMHVLDVLSTTTVLAA